MPMIEAMILPYHLKLEFYSEFFYKFQFEDLVFGYPMLMFIGNTGDLT
jgi:hypothetical protein